jgi:hypothetical protein
MIWNLIVIYICSTSWKNQPYSRGSYTAMAVGACQEDIENIAFPMYASPHQPKVWGEVSSSLWILITWYLSSRQSCSQGSTRILIFIQRSMARTWAAEQPRGFYFSRTHLKRLLWNRNRRTLVPGFRAWRLTEIFIIYEYADFNCSGFW